MFTNILKNNYIEVPPSSIVHEHNIILAGVLSLDQIKKLVKIHTSKFILET